MKLNFSQWLENLGQENTKGKQAYNALANFGAGAKQGAMEMQDRYAQRIIAGEASEQVLQGMKPNGAVWTAVMQKVAELRGQSQPQNSQTGQVSLSSFADKIGDLNWQSLYEIFERQFSKFPNDPKVTQLGQALHQAAQTNNMSGLAPFVQQHLRAQRIS